MPAQVFLGQIDAVLVPVEAHVLPEIDQLQAGADGVGLFQVLRAGGVEQMQHQPADRIGRARAVVQQRGVILVARDGDVLFEGRQQVVERRDRQLVARDGGRQRPKIPRQRRIAGGAWRPARRRCGAARRERPPAAVAVRRRWQALRRRYRRGAGEPVDIGHGGAACAAAAARRRGNSRSDRWAWSCVAVWRRRPSGAVPGCVQPNICRTSCPGPSL